MALKTCIKCGIPKDETEGFYFLKRLNRRHTTCKNCQNQWNVAWARRNREQYLAYHRKWAKERRLKNPELYFKDTRKKTLKKFGESVEWWQKTFDAQGGVCGICRRPETTVDNRGLHRVKNLAIDHDHATNKARGLLCQHCNTALHNVERSANWPARAAAYLRRFRPDPPEDEQTLPFGD